MGNVFKDGNDFAARVEKHGRRRTMAFSRFRSVRSSLGSTSFGYSFHSTSPLRGITIWCEPTSVHQGIQNPAQAQPNPINSLVQPYL